MASLDLVSRLLFPTPPSSYGLESFPKSLIWIPKRLDTKICKPKDVIPCVFLPSPSARFLVLYCHSNAEDLGRCFAALCHLRAQFQVHVLAFEFPGYGLCHGTQATEETVTENAQAVFRFIREVICWPLDSIIIMGRSVGTGPALLLASQHEVHGVVLIAPFLSIRELFKEKIGGLANMFVDRFPNKDRLPMLKTAILIIHGKMDKMIPYFHSEQLYAACRCRKRLVCPADMEHNTHLHINLAHFVLPMLQFFSLPDYSFEELVLPRWLYRVPFGYAEAYREGENMEERLACQGRIPRRGFDIDIACEIVVAASEEDNWQPNSKLGQDCENSTTSTGEGVNEEMPEPASEGFFFRVPKTAMSRRNLSPSPDIDDILRVSQIDL